MSPEQTVLEAGLEALDLIRGAAELEMHLVLILQRAQLAAEGQLPSFTWPACCCWPGAWRRADNCESDDGQGRADQECKRELIWRVGTNEPDCTRRLWLWWYVSGDGLCRPGQAWGLLQLVKWYCLLGSGVWWRDRSLCVCVCVCGAVQAGDELTQARVGRRRCFLEELCRPGRSHDACNHWLTGDCGCGVVTRRYKMR